MNKVNYLEKAIKTIHNQIFSSSIEIDYHKSIQKGCEYDIVVNQKYILSANEANQIFVHSMTQNEDVDFICVFQDNEFTNVVTRIINRVLSLILEDKLRKLPENIV